MSLSIEKAMSLAKRHEKKREYEQARQIYTAVLQKFPSNLRVQKALNALGGAKQDGQSLDLPQNEAQALINLFQQSKFRMVLQASAAIAAKHPSSAFLWDITGMANASLGGFADAEACFRKVIAIKPDFADAHNNLGNTLKEQGMFVEAAECYQRAIAINPDHAEAYNGLGVVQLELGRVEEAIESLQRALKLNPGQAGAQNNLGNALKEVGNLDEAAACYKKAIEYYPGYAEAYSNLGNVLQLQEKHVEAIESYQKALEIHPGFAEVYNNIGIIQQKRGKHEEAASNYTEAIALKPDFAEACKNLGTLHWDLGAVDKAIAAFEHAVEINPEYLDALILLGAAMQYVGELDATIEYQKRVLAINPDHAGAHCKLGNIYHDMGRFDEAVVHTAKALDLQPDFAEALTQMGLIHADWGQIDKAAEYYRQSIERHPQVASPYLLYAEITKFEAGDPLIAHMETLSETETLSQSDRAHIKLALAKAYDDLGDIDVAFPVFLEANRLRKASLRNKFDASSSSFADLKAKFSQEGDIAEISQAELSVANRVPIFIVGMPRSGTTLVEQIVSGHERVHGAGELNDLTRAVGAMRKQHPDDHASMLKGVREHYLQSLDKIGVSEHFIADKMPLNFRWVGYIACAFPEAKIVNMVRDPRAVCWSNFRYFFAGQGNNFAYDLEDVANYFVMYSDLMDFWRRRFPNRIYDMNYRALTEDPETTAREMFDFLGLEWQPDCLDFHHRKRMIQTVSKAQIRKKIYTGSSEEWRRYEAHLQPMIRILEDAGLV